MVGCQKGRDVCPVKNPVLLMLKGNDPEHLEEEDPGENCLTHVQLFMHGKTVITQKWFKIAYN